MKLRTVMYKAWALPLAVGMIMLAGCSGSTNSADMDYLVTIQTPMGSMKAILYEETPLHKANFLKLAEEGKYDNTLWHRVIEGFMIQGGDVYGGNQEPEGGRIPAEIVPGLFHVKGALAAARQGDQINPEKKSSSCQFYIVDGEPYERLTTNLGLLNSKFGEMVNSDADLYRDILLSYQEALQTGGREGAIGYVYSIKDQIAEATNTNFEQPLPPDQDAAYKAAGAGTMFLDSQYTVFGKVVEGLDVIDKIAAVETGQGDKPTEEIDMTMKVESVPKAEITEKYGYQYPTVE
ncbi:MAG: peptidylprolyl isomerase [Bacteroidota bacterium]